MILKKNEDLSETEIQNNIDILAQTLQENMRKMEEMQAIMEQKWEKAQKEK